MILQTQNLGSHDFLFLCKAWLNKQKLIYKQMPLGNCMLVCNINLQIAGDFPAFDDFFSIEKSWQNLKFELKIGK